MGVFAFTYTQVCLEFYAVQSQQLLILEYECEENSPGPFIVTVANVLNTDTEIFQLLEIGRLPVVYATDILVQLHPQDRRRRSLR